MPVYLSTTVDLRAEALRAADVSIQAAMAMFDARAAGRPGAAEDFRVEWRAGMRFLGRVAETAVAGAFIYRIPASLYAAIAQGADYELQGYLQTMQSRGMLAIVPDADARRTIVQAWQARRAALQPGFVGLALLFVSIASTYAGWYVGELLRAGITGDAISRRLEEASAGLGRWIGDLLGRVTPAILNWWLIIIPIGLLGAVLYVYPQIMQARAARAR